MKRETQFAIILFYNAGFKPKDIIKMGYSPVTVYRYSRKYKEAKKEFQEKLKR